MATTRVTAVALFLFLFSGYPVRAVNLDYSGNSQDSALFVETVKGGQVVGSGTAFEVIYTSAPWGELHFLTTAKHVVENGDLIRVHFNRNLNEPDSKAGKSRIKSFDVPLFENGRKLWQEAPDAMDIGVVFILQLSTNAQANAEAEASQYATAKDSGPIDSTWRANPPVRIPSDIVEHLDRGQLNDLFFAGYPLGLRSGIWLKAFARRCTMAADSIEGMNFIDANRNYFLIDCAPFEGDSGSPIFLHQVDFHRGALTVSNRLAGVISGKVQLDQTSKSNSQTLDTEMELSVRRKVPILGKVAPSRYIEKAILAFLDRLESEPANLLFKPPAATTAGQ